MSAVGVSSIVRLLHDAGAREPGAFYARWDMRKIASPWYVDTYGFPTFLGGRIRPYAHQIYAARRVLGDPTQRFLLADEVGLGKTIEAGMILQALWHHSPDHRVLIVTPGAMIHQWFRELYLRFGARVFRYIDTSALRRKGAVARALESNWLLVSNAALLASSTLQAQLKDCDWQSLVIDEAHTIDSKHPLYSFCYELSARAENVLVLSATPSRRQLSGLAALLALVNPRAISPFDVDGLKKRVELRDEAWRAIDQTDRLVRSALAEPDDLEQEDIDGILENWGDVLRDPRVDEWFTEAREQSTPKLALETIRVALAYAREKWRLDHRIIRTRRRTLEILDQPFARRELTAHIEYEPCAGELEVAEALRDLPAVEDDSQGAWCEILNRMAAAGPELLLPLLRVRQDALAGDGPNELISLGALWRSEPSVGEETLLLRVAASRCPPLEAASSNIDFDEIDWIEGLLGHVELWASSEPGAIARHRAVSDWIAERYNEDDRRKFLVFSQETTSVVAFAKHMVTKKIDVATFTDGMEPDALEEAALSFTRGSTPVLICDELGGEGRNFQAAWAVIHLDQPVSPNRMEQRIGRADRLGRPTDDVVRSVVVTGPVDAEQLLFKAHCDVFRVFSESIGGLEFVIPDLTRRIREGLQRRDIGASKDLLAELKNVVTRVREQSDDAFESAFDTSRAGLEEAADIAEIVAEVANDKRVTRRPIHWLRALGVAVGGQHSQSQVAVIPDALEEEGIPHLVPFRATWKQSEALSKEHLQFLAPGHVLVDAAVHRLEEGNVGRVTALKRVLPNYRGRVLAVALFVTELIDGEDLVPAGLLARVRAVVGRDLAAVVFCLDEEREQWSLVDDPKLVAYLEVPFSKHKEQVWPEFSEAIDSDCLDALERTLCDWSQSQEDAMHDTGTKAVEELARAWGNDFAYLDAERGGTDEQRRQRAEIELELRLYVLERVQQLKPRLDALALFKGV